MSFEADSVEHERSIGSQNEEIIKLLKAILLGIEMLADADELIENVEE